MKQKWILLAIFAMFICLTGTANASHMQAPLPGGTNFNWGSDAAAARRGIGGTGAFDPAFTQHFYRFDQGGVLPPGTTLVQNDTGQNEDVSVLIGALTIAIARAIGELHGEIKKLGDRITGEKTQEAQVAGQGE